MHPIIPLIAFAARLINAQSASLPDLSLLPQCALEPATTALSASGCKLTDITCICQAPAFIKAVGTQIAASCEPADQKKAVEFANSICQPLGVTVPSDGLDEDGKDDSAEGDKPEGSTPEASTPTEDNKEVPADTTAEPSAAAETGTVETPPYPVPGNGSNSTTTNTTALPFEGAGSSLAGARLEVAVQAAFVGLFVALGFATVL